MDPDNRHAARPGQAWPGLGWATLPELPKIGYLGRYLNQSNKETSSKTYSEDSMNHATLSDNCTIEIVVPWNSQYARGGSRIFERGGGSRRGYRIFHKHPPLDIVRVTSSALRKVEKHPHSWTFTSTPPLDIVRVTSSALRKFEKHPHSWTFTSTPPWALPV